MPLSPLPAPRAMHPSVTPPAPRMKKKSSCHQPPLPQKLATPVIRSRILTKKAIPIKAWIAGINRYAIRSSRTSHGRFSRAMPPRWRIAWRFPCAQRVRCRRSARKVTGPCWSTLVAAAATPRQPASSRRSPRSWSSVNVSRHGPAPSPTMLSSADKRLNWPLPPIPAAP